MALPDTPLTRGEVYLNAIANESSDVPTPLTREEQYLNAIAKGDTGGIPSAPLTRTEQYLDYIAQNGGGGGGEKTLQNSGWVKSYEEYAEIAGNLVTLKSGSTYHALGIAPPSIVRGSARFESGDVLIIAFTVKELNQRASINMQNQSNWSTESATGLMTTSGGTSYTKTTGSDVLTFTFTATSGNSSSLNLTPTKSSDGSSLSSAYATIEVTGMRFNGTLIFGSVTPPNA